MVPMVATSAGTPIVTTMSAFSSPQATPMSKETRTASGTLSVASHTRTNPTMPSAMTDGKERSISPATTTSVSGRATMPNIGIVAA